MAGMTCPASKNERPPHFGQTLPRRWCDRGAPLVRVGGVSERSPVAPTWHSIWFGRGGKESPYAAARFMRGSAARGSSERSERREPCPASTRPSPGAVRDARDAHTVPRQRAGHLADARCIRG